jgi:two-component system, NarL family, invasion response regulator UvrY
MKKVKVLIADDHTVVRRGLRQILSATVDIVVGDEAANGADAISMICKNRYDVVLLDISMPGRNGLDILKQIRIHDPKLPVLILSMHSEDEYAVRCLKAGAAGYLTKESLPEEILAAIRKVAKGGKYINLSLAEKLPFAWEPQTEKPSHVQLSDRELQVMCMLARGKTTGEIAVELSLSSQTISTYKSRILEKMKMQSIAQVIRYAIENGLVP